MYNQSLISIIIPIYNAEKYLSRCLDSIVNQTYPSLEILLINDGSFDSSKEICQNYQNKDKRIVLINQENQGLSQARNTGIDASKGEYLTFIDADDYIHPRYIEYLYRAIVENQVMMSVCNYKEVFQSQSFSEQAFISYRKSTESIFQEMFTATYGIFLTAWGTLSHRNIWKTLRFPVGKIHEDEFVFHQIYSQMDNIAYVDLPLYFYFQNENSIMRQNNKIVSHPDCLEAFRNRWFFFYSRDKDIAKKIQKRLIKYLFYFYSLKPQHSYYWEFKTWYQDCKREYPWKTRILYSLFSTSPYMYGLLKKGKKRFERKHV